MKIFILLFSIILTTSCIGDKGKVVFWYLDNSKDKQTERFINDNYKTSAVYLDYGATLIVSAFYKDLEYRKLFQRELSRLYFLEEEIQEELWKDNIREYQNFFEFLVIVYSRDNRKADFGQKNSQWRVFLWDNEDYKLIPSVTYKMSSKSKEKIFLDKYLYPLNRWSEVYSVKFPKYNRFDRKNAKKFRLAISGIKGQAVLTWPDAGLFYQNPESLKSFL